MSLIAVDVALEIIVKVKPLLEKIWKHDRNLEDEGRRAATSIALNSGEGSRRRGRDRPHAFTVAMGSADELQKVLRIGIAWGYVTSDECVEALKLIDRELGLLFGLIRSGPRR
jgi:four helix bundle protein